MKDSEAAVSPFRRLAERRGRGMRSEKARVAVEALKSSDEFCPGTVTEFMSLVINP